MIDDYVLNFGITCKRPLDLQSQSTSDFLDKLSDAAPTLDRINEDAEKGTIELFEQGRLRRLREIEIKPGGLGAAAGNEITPDERHGFLRIVATAAESLKIPKRDVSLVDFRVFFRIEHWGNHHDLVAKALWEPGPLYTMVHELGMPLDDVTIGIRTSPPDRDEFAIGLTVNPRTAPREIRSGEYDGDKLAVVAIIGRTHGFHRAGSFPEMLAELEDIWTKMASKPIANLAAVVKGLAVPEKPKDRS